MKKLVPVLAAAVLLALALAPASLAAKPGSRAPSELTLLLELRHPAGLEHFVRAVSDPASPHYREYATVEELVKYFGAAPEDRAAAMRWLAARGLHGTVGPTGTYVIARVPAALASRAMPRAATASAAGDSVGAERQVPSGLRGHVTSIEAIGTAPGAFASNAEVTKPKLGTELGIKGTSLLPNTGTTAGCPEGQSAGLEPPVNGFTPIEYLDAYGHSALQEQGYKGQGKSVALIEIDGFRKSDIATFAKCFGRKLPKIQVRPVGIKKPLAPGAETTLDLEVLTAAVPKLEHAYVYEGGSSELGILLSVASALGSPGHHPDAISISLGGCEPELIAQLAFREALDNVFAVADGAGISVLVAAGDQGSSSCKVETETGQTALPLISASDPASSPFVTAVGGTNLKLNKKNRIKNEIVWNDAPIEFGGGGGAPSILTVPRPWYQHGLRSGYGNGRLVPDVAGLADLVPGYAIYCTAPECVSPETLEAGWTTIGGTSAATPLYAGGVLLADGYEQRHGAPPLGFLNPLIYAAGRASGKGHGGSKGPGRVLRDVTSGNNDLGILTPADAGGGHPLGCCVATRGYDLASGWGSVNVDGLAHLGLRALGR